MMHVFSEDQLQANLETFYGYIKKYIKKERADQLLDMYKAFEVTLATSPASTKKSHHNAFVGGYVDHVNRVIEAALVMDKVWDRFNQVKDYTTEELVFSAANHDLGKMGSEEEPNYLPNDSEWHVKNQGAYFKYNPALVHMRISDRSLFILQKYQIPVNEREFLAIKLHDGLYEEANKPYYIASPEFRIKTNLVYILHQADQMAARVEQQINQI
jgi:hypothetical protein